MNLHFNIEVNTKQHSLLFQRMVDVLLVKIVFGP